MKRYFIYLAYNGEKYCGWQVQPNGTSIQQILEEALGTMLRTPIEVTGAGRTDAGVHARQMVAHFDTNLEDPTKLVDKLNRYLPKDITIHSIRQVRSDAHARFDAVARIYKYYLTTKKDPFFFPFKHRIHEPMNIEQMNECADQLFNHTDFTSFSKLHTDVKTNNCRIMYARWEKEGGDYVFTIKADRFLRNMVRAIVGTLYEAGRGRLDARGMNRIIECKNRAVAGNSMPGNALFLEEVEYPTEIFDI